MDKQLKDKAITIKGKEYVQVSDRILYFNEVYPKGMIETDLVSEPGDERVIIKATITPEVNVPRQFTGYSQAVWGDGYINKTSALENAETSAVGRALAMLGIGVIESVASSDEIQKADYASAASMYQVTEIKKLFALLKITPEVQTQILSKANAKKVEDLSTSRADFLIKSLRERRDK
jgi:hypothetical protein